MQPHAGALCSLESSSTRAPHRHAADSAPCVEGRQTSRGGEGRRAARSRSELREQLALGILETQFPAFATKTTVNMPAKKKSPAKKVAKKAAPKKTVAKKAPAKKAPAKKAAPKKKAASKKKAAPKKKAASKKK